MGYYLIKNYPLKDRGFLIAGIFANILTKTKNYVNYKKEYKL